MIEQIRLTERSKMQPVPKASSDKVSGFKDILAKEQKNTDVKISNHAMKRLESRQLDLAGADLATISEAMGELADKGSKECLLVYKDMGLIANVPNRTIITAIQMSEMETITNIDSAKFIK